MTLFENSSYIYTTYKILDKKALLSAYNIFILWKINWGGSLEWWTRYVRVH